MDGVCVPGVPKDSSPGFHQPPACFTFDARGAAWNQGGAMRLFNWAFNVLVALAIIYLVVGGIARSPFF
jgi:hypothetical protein